MANAYGAYMTGVIGGYPNGGFPAQAFYGVMGQPAGMSKGGTSNGGSSDINFFGTSSKVTVLATILILMFGGYFLWHFTM